MNDKDLLPSMIKANKDAAMGLEQMIEFGATQARLYFATFGALTAEGFTQDQAIDLLKARGGMLLG